jgi:group I intron endonuclease
MTSGIYCIECKGNNKKYVGKSFNIENRIKEHIRGFNRKAYKYENFYLINSWEKYGKDSFIFYILEKCDINMLDERERFYIESTNTKHPNGFNFTDGGSGVLGYKHSEESKIKIGTNTPKRFGENHPNWGKHTPQEIKDKMSKKNSQEKSPRFGIKDEDSASIFHGVVIHNHKQNKNGKEYVYVYWIAKLRVIKKEIVIGRYKKEIDAALAYDKYIIEHNLPNTLNFPSR